MGGWAGGGVTRESRCGASAAATWQSAHGHSLERAGVGPAPPPRGWQRRQRLGARGQHGAGLEARGAGDACDCGAAGLQLLYSKQGKRSWGMEELQLWCGADKRTGRPACWSGWGVDGVFASKWSETKRCRVFLSGARKARYASEQSAPPPPPCPGSPLKPRTSCF